MQKLAFLLAGLLFAGSASAIELFIDLRTDYTTADFRFVRVELLDRADERRSWITMHSAGGGRDYAAGVRIAELDDVEQRHNYFLVVQLLDGLMRPVHGRVFLHLTGTANQGQIVLVVRP